MLVDKFSRFIALFIKKTTWTNKSSSIGITSGESVPSFRQRWDLAPNAFHLLHIITSQRVC